jgi:hypothetical protein
VFTSLLGLVIVSHLSPRGSGALQSPTEETMLVFPFSPHGSSGNVVCSFVERATCGLASGKLPWHRIERGQEVISRFASMAVEMKSDD